MSLRLQANITIKLSKTDWHLPRLLAMAEASIFEPNSVERLVGSGPFSLAIFSNKMLRLNRNDAYSNQVPILNRVELWVYPEAESKACAQNQVCVKMPEKTLKVGEYGQGHA